MKPVAVRPEVPAGTQRPQGGSIFTPQVGAAKPLLSLLSEQ